MKEIPERGGYASSGRSAAELPPPPASVCKPRAVSDNTAGYVAGDVSEWLCHRCNVIHPHKRGDFLTAPCPACDYAMVPTSANVREIERLRARVAESEGIAVTEHAIQMTDGSYQVRNDAPYAEAIYPLAMWIKNQQRDHGGAYCRKVIVVEDWTEVPRQD